MPIYEYECRQCGKIEEAIQKFSDKPLTTCTHCSGALVKLVSHSSFHLKGGGWYTDGYGEKASAKPEQAKEDSGSTNPLPAKPAESSTKDNT